MKAIRMHAVGGPEVLRVEETEVPVPGDDQVLVKVAVAGVTYGDIMKRSGGFGPNLPLPCGLGFDVAGTVEAVGGAVTGLPTGSRVAARVEAGYAEYAVARAVDVTPVPDGVDLHAAVAIPVQGLTAYQALRLSGDLRKGQSVVVQAATGGVGTLAVQLARLMGAGTVIGTGGGPGKLAHIRALGADAALDHGQEDWPAQVVGIVGGEGADLVLEAAGGHLAQQALRCVTPFGRMVSYGMTAGSPAEVSSVSLMATNRSVVGYSLIGWLQRPDRTAEAVEDLMRWLRAGDLRVVVGGTFPLHEAAAAHRMVAERRAVGKLLLVP